MSDRERVRAAIDASVGAASKLREEMPEANTEARLLAAIDGWGRGLAAGLEELAVAVQELRRLTLEPGSTATPAPPRRTTETIPESHDESHAGSDERAEESGTPTPEQQRARAAASREETQALRRQATNDNQPDDDDGDDVPDTASS